MPLRRGALSEARRYSPRGRTVRDTHDDRHDHHDDAPRPDLKVVSDRRRGSPPAGDTDRRRREGTGGADSDRRRRKDGTDRRGDTAGNRDTAGKRGAADTRRADRGDMRRGDRADTRGRRGAETRGGADKRRGGGDEKRRRGVGRSGSERGRQAARRPKRPVRAGRAVRLGEPRRRLRIGTALILLVFVVIAGRLVELQFTEAPALAAEGLDNRLRTTPLYAPRGAILDRDGTVLVHSVEARDVSANPEEIKDAADAAARLSPLLGIPASRLAEKLKRRVVDGVPVRYALLARGLDIDDGEAVRSLKIAGIYLDRGERRDVPGHDLAANLLGFVGHDGDGLYGLESTYDNKLKGTAGELVVERVDGKDIPGGYRKQTSPKPGIAVQLTIDRDLQFQVQGMLTTALDKAKAKWGSAVVIDVATGEVVADASYPTYDAADPFATDDQERWQDVSTSVVFEPGSVHKAITIGAALQEGAVKPDDTFMVEPSIHRGDKDFVDAVPHPTALMTLPGILAYSSNVGTIKIGEKLGPDKLFEYQKKFGLGTRPETGLPNEAPGLLQKPADWSGTDRGSIPIGHGVSTTPMQMAAAFAAIANDGKWVQPHVVKATVGADGKPVVPRVRTQQALSPEIARTLRNDMEAVVVADHGTGRAGAIPLYRVAGKTGTGLMRGPDGKQLTGSVASFIGMAPVDAPRFVVAVSAYIPGASDSGASAPIFKDVMTATLRKFHVAPTGTPVPDFRIFG